MSTACAPFSMTKIVLIAGGDLDQLAPDADCYVGVDAGALRVLERQLPLSLAIGDFDSISAEELALIRQSAGDVVTLPRHKDDTDLEAALKIVLARYPGRQVTVYGGFGGRLDHQLSNIFLPSDPDLAPDLTRIQLQDRQNLVTYYPSGISQIASVAGYDYVSFFPVGGEILSIQNAKYNLEAGHTYQKACYASNEFVDGDIQVSLSRGYLLVIQSRDRR